MNEPRCISGIPLLLTPDEQAIQGTTLIMEHLENQVDTIEGFGPFTASGEVQCLVADRIELFGDLDAHFREHAFLFGERPCTGDFALAGALYAHLYRDATAGTDALPIAGNGELFCKTGIESRPTYRDCKFHWQ
ncbi:MAG: hypothetical protein AB8B57_00745 [Congregibacter sp.]